TPAPPTATPPATSPLRGKSEIRNPKSERNSKDEEQNTKKASPAVSDFGDLSLRFLSDFGFRISDLALAPAPPRPTGADRRSRRSPERSTNRAGPPVPPVSETRPCAAASTPTGSRRARTTTDRRHRPLCSSSSTRCRPPTAPGR